MGCHPKLWGPSKWRVFRVNPEMNSPLVALPARLMSRPLSRRPWFLKVPTVTMSPSFKAKVIGCNSQFLELFTLWLQSGAPNEVQDFAADLLLMEAGVLAWPPVKQGTETDLNMVRKIKNAFRCTEEEANVLKEALPVDVEEKKAMNDRLAKVQKGEGKHFVAAREAVEKNQDLDVSYVFLNIKGFI